MIAYAALRARWQEETALGRSAAPGLARALEAIGWRAVEESSPDELASHLVWLVEACVHVHHDVDALTHAIAGLLRDHGPLLDGGLPPVEAYGPAAEELLRCWIAPAPRVRLDPFA